MKNFAAALLAVCIGSSVFAQKPAEVYHEPYRPQFHFSPKAHWMNDPNGMVYVNGTYHLFFQYNPSADVPGNIHWGHAISKDMVHWKELPVALYPDSLGLVFSGSAVWDKNNTSGLGKSGHPPMVALYASHSVEKEKAGRTDVETQSLAYSTDEGKIWHKYKGNPVIKNMGDRDFRDPKVSWYEPQKKWVMVVAAHDHIDFFSSKNLINWTKESEFGQQLGAHGGVWECPDLFPLTSGNTTKWVLIVNINPGGPNGGSATQYFTGNFNGKTFTPDNSSATKWADFGPDNYAGVTWSNTGKRIIFLGWMSNWRYGDKVPTSPWRSAMTVPRELSLKKVGGQTLLASEPVGELHAITSKENSWANVKVNGSYDIASKVSAANGKFILKLKNAQANDFSIVLSNKKGEQVVVGYRKQDNQYFIDRSKAGQVDFQLDFAKTASAPRLLTTGNIDLILVVDAASVELFADGGLTNMTAIFFPTQPFTGLAIKSQGSLNVGKISYAKVNSTWNR
ncbi:glycoside hydrolase family 32 protein [Mucilaginibacter agri]|uniref:Glycoside hydrolase family 32 protein n=1 Tax=Mucilaginibacter agri TaxID=2695265 RepID=A0A966DWF5_9SPHI|nr:glycoside hydrolase family 32 protein [Mucilaginibacter agri]NCD71364.1 glycoside hydrolase family 32 protein [Mucilaginibacter agri]